MKYSIKKLHNLLLNATSIALLACLLPSCSSETNTKENDTITEIEASQSDVAFDVTTDTTADASKEEEWPDSTHFLGKFQEEPKPELSTTTAVKQEVKATEKKPAAIQAKTTSSNSSSDTPKSMSSKQAKPNTTTTATTAKTVSEKKLTAKFNKMMALKVEIGNKLDCMRISPMNRTHLGQTKRLHDKFLGILPKMLIWARFEDNKLSKIMKKDPESLVKLDGMSDRWQNSYESINRKADAILDQYKEKEFYGNCKGK